MLKQCQRFKDLIISYDDEQRSLIVNNHLLRFGPGQYTLLKLLLEHQEVRDDDLALAVYQHPADGEYHALLTRNIAKLRLKIHPHGLTITRLYGEGYRLASSDDESA